MKKLLIIAVTLTLGACAEREMSHHQLVYEGRGGLRLPFTDEQLATLESACTKDKWALTTIVARSGRNLETELPAIGYTASSLERASNSLRKQREWTATLTEPCYKLIYNLWLDDYAWDIENGRAAVKHQRELNQLADDIPSPPAI